MLKLLERLEDMLFLVERRINIGINHDADETTRHGVLWVDAEPEGQQKQSIRVPIIIDKPHLVSSGLSYATWRRVKRQIEKMGIKATHIELLFKNGDHFCYQLDEYKELYAQGRGKPLCYEPTGY